MNPYYSYPGIELWQTEKWADRKAPLHKLIEYIMEHDTIEESDYVPSYPYREGEMNPLFRAKTHGIDDPKAVEELKEAGLHYLCTGQGGGAGGTKERCWICLCPQKNIDEWRRLPVLMVFDREDESTPLWTMRALKRYEKYVEMLKASMDFMLVIFVNEVPDYAGIYFGIMQEFSVLFPSDTDRFYLDVGKALEKTALRDIPGFRMRDPGGNEQDPDGLVESFGSLRVPVLNLKGNWGNGDSLERGLVMTFIMNEGRFDREWLIHSELGRRMVEDMGYEYRYDTVEDPRFLQEMEEKGIRYHIRYNALGERYLVAVPKSALESEEKLPVVLIFQEVYGGNEHLAVSAQSYLAEWIDIAAQGECILVYFVLEDIVSNDRAVDVVKAAAREFPMDLNRLYVTGHSHDGYFTYAFANRNPEFVTAMATMGMGLCPVGMNDLPDYSTTDPIAKYDIPTISLTGLCESSFPVDEEDKRGRWLPMLKQIFRNYRIPMRSDEEILGAFESRNAAERITALPGDHFETLWLAGFENYIVDFTNVDGKNHLRVVRGQNMPHTVTPTMCTLAWSFLRRFAKDPETGKLYERY